MTRYSDMTDEELVARWQDLRAAAEEQFGAWVVRTSLEELMRRRGIPLPLVEYSNRPMLRLNRTVIDLDEERSKRRGGP